MSGEAEKSQVWDADISITPEQAAHLITRQFPDMAPVRLEVLGAGWDNIAFRINDDRVFRFPRRKIAVGLLEQETRLLPRLAPFLPLPVPVPVYVGAPTDEYPYPFTGYRLLAGTTACRVSLSEAERVQNAVPLACFLRELHTCPLRDPEAPGDEMDRANLARQAPRLIERLQTLVPLTNDLDIPALIGRVERLASETPPWDGRGVWVHGDLYARHLLVDDNRLLCGIIDWGDIHRGDPAIDLGIAWGFLPPRGEARDLFRDAYGPLDNATWDRARFRALHYGAVLALYGADIGDTALREAGEYALRAAL